MRETGNLNTDIETAANSCCELLDWLTRHDNKGVCCRRVIAGVL
jgi:hypothetical protein